MHPPLRALVDRFTDLTDNAQAFMGSLLRTIDLHDADAFRAYKGTGGAQGRREV